MKRLILIMLGLSLQVWGANTYYMLAGGTSTCTVGVTNNWTTACKIIPDPMNAGDTVVIGNDGGNFNAAQARHVFNGSGTSIAHITVRFASASLDSGVTGWSGAYAVAPALWSNAKIVTDGLILPFWDFCGSYYDIDGLVGTPFTSGTYGFRFFSGARMFGFLRVNPVVGNCAGAPNVTNITFNHVELDGSSPDSSVVLGLGKVNTDGTTTVTWASGSQFSTSGYWNSKPVSINRVAKVISTVTDATHMVLTTTTAAASNQQYTAGQSGASGLYFGVSTGTNTTQNLSVSNSYIHDIATPIQVLTFVTGLTLTGNKIARTYSDISNHSNGISVQGITGSIALNNLISHGNIWEDIQGTGTIICLNGLCSGWQIYDELTYFTSAFSAPNVYTNGTFPGCSHGDYSTACDVSKFAGDNTPTGKLSNSNIYGNTVASVRQASAVDFPGFGADNCGVVISVTGSSGNDVQNNLFYNCANVFLPTSTFSAHGNNSAYSATFSGDTPAVTDKTYLGVNPFTSSTFSGASSMALTAVTDAGNTLGAPFNVDYLGVSRGTACNSGWCRGALEFAVVAATYPVTASCPGNANGTIIGSAGSVMNAVCTAGVCSGTCSESITAGNSGTYTGAATTGSMTAFSIGVCVTSPCTVTVNSPLTVSATFQANVTCTLTCVLNNINSPATVSCTAALTGLSSNYLWELTEPINGNVIAACNTDNCKTGATGNLQYTGSGIYTLIATGNGVLCTASTQPLNINNIGIGGIAH